MFLPQTAHVTRTYGAGHHPAGGHPTTSRKNINKENAFALPSKTPSRINVYKGDAGAAGPSYGGGAGGAPMMLGKPGVTPGPSTRPGLGVKTEARNRNALGDGTGQGGGGGSGGGDKGKGKDVMDLGPKRLFASTTKPSIQPSRSQTFAPLKTPARAPPPASTRTLQNIRTPAPRQQYGFHNQLDVPAATPLPSATRARRKSRQSLNSSGSGSSTKDSVSTPLRPVRDAFQTPGPAQHAWEEEHSLESIEELEATEPEPQPEVLETMQEAVEEVEAEQLEVEYMPPRMEGESLLLVRTRCSDNVLIAYRTALPATVRHARLARDVFEDRKRSATLDLPGSSASAHIRAGSGSRARCRETCHHRV